jgi:hypothetical protein
MSRDFVDRDNHVMNKDMSRHVASRRVDPMLNSLNNHQSQAVTKKVHMCTFSVT